VSVNLTEALHCHQAGRLDEAARLYSAVLSREPNHPDALHLLGAVAFHQGNPALAVELITRAIARNPQAATFHANLAEALRMLGQLDRSIQSSKTALRLQPAFPEAHNNLGLALRAQGRTEEALAHFREAIRLRPEFAVAHNNLADVLREQGQADAAQAEFRRALEMDPNLAEAHSNLGQMLLERQQLDEALAHCREAVRLRPTLPETHNNLGNVLRDLEQIEEAQASYRRALELNPELGTTYANLARTYQEQGQYEEARRWYTEALQRDPASGQLYAQVGALLKAQEHYAEAEAQLRLALQMEPDVPETLTALGSVLHQLGKDNEALACYRQALQLNPVWIPAHVHLGDLLEELGQFPLAEASFREALRLNPAHGGALGQLATMLRGKLPDADLQRMRAMAAAPGGGGGQRAAVLHGLAHAVDARGEYAEAARLLEEGNRLRQAEWERQGKAYDPQEHSRFVDRLIAAFSPELFERTRGFGLATLRPVFVLGLPRSATTLTEQIIASHSQAFGAGELRLAREGFEGLPQLMGQSGPAVDCLPQLDRDTTRRAAQLHLDELLLRNDTAGRIIDKMPDNYLYLGWLAVLFPRARFIHTRRDLRDVAVSCWMTNFKQIRWACTPEYIAGRFRDYLRLMEHWRRVLPVPLLEVDYEDTVVDLETTARRLIDWCGLEWEPSCLAFHESRGPIRTASVSQVRQPLYSRSVARWRNYEPYLADLFEQLPTPASPHDPAASLRLTSASCA